MTALTYAESKQSKLGKERKRSIEESDSESDSGSDSESDSSSDSDSEPKAIAGEDVVILENLPHWIPVLTSGELSFYKQGQWRSASDPTLEPVLVSLAAEIAKHFFMQGFINMEYLGYMVKIYSFSINNEW